LVGIAFDRARSFNPGTTFRSRASPTKRSRIPFSTSGLSALNGGGQASEKAKHRLPYFRHLALKLPPEQGPFVIRFLDDPKYCLLVHFAGVGH
jgi:hypothetical protein